MTVDSCCSLIPRALILFSFNKFREIFGFLPSNDVESQPLDRDYNLPLQT